MFIQTEETPNPNALKFIPGIKITNNISRSYSRNDSLVKSPLAYALFSISQIKEVYISEDFITITKGSNSDWTVLKTEVLVNIMDYLVSGRPAILEDDEGINEEQDSDIVKQIKEIIEHRVRPAVANDGGDVLFRSFENGVVKLQLKGSCAGCPSANITLKDGIENMLKHYVPEIISVEEVKDYE